MIFFGRDWRNLEDYTDIDKYHPAMQAWEFLRRKKSYQNDCLIAEAIDEFDLILGIRTRNKITKTAYKKELTSEDLANEVNSKVICTESVLGLINELSVDEISQLLADNEWGVKFNTIAWVRKRHDLEFNLSSKPYHSMPNEDIPGDWNCMFKVHKAGYKAYIGCGEEKKIIVHPREAAVMIDLTRSIPDQMDGLKKELIDIQKTLKDGLMPIIRKKTLETETEMDNHLKRSQRLRMWKKSLWNPNYGFPGVDVSMKRETLTTVSSLIRLLDAREMTSEGWTLTSIYKEFDPDGYREIYKLWSKGGKDKNIITEAAKNCLASTDKREKAEYFRDKGYNRIANKSPSIDICHLDARLSVNL